jgi:hypothetical protein
MQYRMTVGVAVLALALGCGKSSSPTAPTATAPTATTPAARVKSLTITATRDVLLVNSTSVLTSIAHYDDGTSEPISATWESSTGRVSLLTNGPVTFATSQAAGEAVITARAAGVSATQSLRAIPNLSGTWLLQTRVTQCSPPERWGASFCGSNPGALSNATLRLSHTTGDGITGTYQYTSPNGDVRTGSVSGRVLDIGTVNLTGRLASPDSQTGNFSAEVDFRVTVSATLSLSGSYSEVVTLSGERDPAFVAVEVVRGSR